MRKINTNSVAFTIGGAVSLMVLVAVSTIAIAVTTVYSSLDDAEAVNVSGSMRMQSYRLAFDVITHSNQLDKHIVEFEHSLYSPSMKSVNHWMTPLAIRDDYNNLIARWLEVKSLMQSDNKQNYSGEVSEFVTLIDRFVLKIQHYSERKLLNMVVISLFGITVIMLLSFVIMRFVRVKVIQPLEAMARASRAVEANNFEVKLNESLSNELGTVAATFNGMTNNLKNQYTRLEAAVDAKTEQLHKANNSLQVLYQSSQQLSVARITPEQFKHILSNLASVESVYAAKLVIDDAAGQAVEFIEGQPRSIKWQHTRLEIDGIRLGSLGIQTSPRFSEQDLVKNMSQILARGVYYNQAQKKFEQLLIYTERSAIARELHDSLAQSLSFLKIQMSLLKRHLSHSSENGQIAEVVEEIDTGLKEAYTQLRSLLTTFRFSIDEANFGEALHVLMDKLQTHTSASIEITNHLSSLQVQAQQQVHLLQIVREAVNNAIKHAHAKTISINCDQYDQLIEVSIADDGVGFDSGLDKAEHYGLSIMRERAQYLNGKLTIKSEPGTGSQVTVVFNCEDRVASDK
ncbi:nitrate/nitrite two-component system sensor histidine kinase NarQ [Vibrio gallicus]|uniref:nitrate/nitrite two-component system sensor histidine kinase NarQ n=1 Tax=Vibrio gallicus TaxID=190897 RepID=UPI0021C3313F|nr:nitrate/nitrite two-component system sensor histidine kinase NarQ [Vibrio gallicus]